VIVLYPSAVRQHAHSYYITTIQQQHLPPGPTHTRTTHTHTHTHTPSDRPVPLFLSPPVFFSQIKASNLRVKVDDQSAHIDIYIYRCYLLKQEVGQQVMHQHCWLVINRDKTGTVKTGDCDDV